MTYITFIIWRHWCGVWFVLCHVSYYAVSYYAMFHIMPCFILCQVSYYVMFHIMISRFHVMVSRFHIIFRAQWKYHNAIWNVACIMQFWPKYHYKACMHINITYEMFSICTYVVCVCVRACVRACERSCACACECVYDRLSVLCVCICVSSYNTYLNTYFSVVHTLGQHYYSLCVLLPDHSPEFLPSCRQRALHHRILSVHFEALSQETLITTRRKHVLFFASLQTHNVTYYIDNLNV